MDKKNSFVDKLTDILVQQGSLKKSESEPMKENFYNRSKAIFDDFLLEEGIVTKENLLKALKTYYQVPSIDVTGLFFDHDLLLNFPKDFLLENIIIPYAIDTDFLTVIANNPNADDLAAKIEKFTDYDVKFLVGQAQEIIDAIREYYDEPPEGYIHDTTDEDEIDDQSEEKGVDMDDLIEKKDRW